MKAEWRGRCAAFALVCGDVNLAFLPSLRSILRLCCGRARLASVEWDFGSAVSAAGSGFVFAVGSALTCDPAYTVTSSPFAPAPTVERRPSVCLTVFSRSKARVFLNSVWSASIVLCSTRCNHCGSQSTTIVCLNQDLNDTPFK